MPGDPPITIQQLARELRRSPATISLALRDSPKVARGTRIEIQRYAQKRGYIANSAQSASATHRWQQRAPTPVRLLHLYQYPSEDPNTQRARISRARLSTLQSQAHLFSADIESFPVHTHFPELDTFLDEQPRFDGLLIDIFPRNLLKHQFPFNRYCLIHLHDDSFLPWLHSVIDGDIANMLYSTHIHLRHCGHQRIGVAHLYMSDGHKRQHVVDQCLFNTVPPHYSAAELMYYSEPREDIDRSDTHRPSRFLDWFHSHKPDAIIATTAEAAHWMIESGINIPVDCSYVQLFQDYYLDGDHFSERQAQVPELPLAGFIPDREHYSRRVLEIMQMLIRNRDRGIPQHRQCITINGSWTFGQSIWDRTRNTLATGT